MRLNPSRSTTRSRFGRLAPAHSFFLIVSLATAFAGASLAQTAVERLGLPSSDEHFTTYDPPLADLFARVLPTLEPGLQIKLVNTASGKASTGSYAEGEIHTLLESLERLAGREQVLDMFLHESKILDIVPESSGSLRTLVHDSLLVFLSQSSPERHAERITAMLRLPRSAERGERILAFMERTPTLQKIGQILARNPALDLDVRVALQRLENSIRTSTPADLEKIVRADWTLDPSFEDCHAEFDDRVLAEASVGAVIRAELSRGDGPPQMAVSKIVKPYAAKNLEEELEILAGVIDYLAEHGHSYALEAATLSDLFREVREALSKEILVVEEQRNLKMAALYYAGDETVLIPNVLDCSTDNVTFMDFIEGSKITDAYENDPRKRRGLAERLSDLMTYDVLFSTSDHALFHGDPHAGNVLSSPSTRDGDRLSLIDWGLSESLDRQQRVGLIQLLLGIYMSDRERLIDNIDALVHADGDVSLVLGEKEFERRARVIDSFLETREANESLFESLESFVGGLAREGYRLRYNMTLYVKSQLTIEGILAELDPEFRQDRRVMSRLSARALREFPKRVGRTLWFPSWSSREYGSLLSNEDVKDIQWYRFKRRARWIGRGIWRVLSAPVRALRGNKSGRASADDSAADAVLEQIFLHAVT